MGSESVEKERTCEAYSEVGQDCFTAGAEVVSAEGLCGPCAERVLMVLWRCEGLWRAWRNRSIEHLANAKNRIDAGMGGSYSVASEALRQTVETLRIPPRYRPASTTGGES